MSKNLFLTVLSIFLSFCPAPAEDKNSQIDFTIEFTEYLKNLGKEGPLASSYLIIPANICPSCIEHLKEFLLGDPMLTTRIILVGKSRKKLRLTFSDEIIGKKSVWLDVEGKWYNSSLIDENVAEIFYTIEDRVVKKSSIYPSNIVDVLEDLESWSMGGLNAKLFKLQNQNFSEMINSKAPEIDAISSSGKDFKLSEQSGSIVVMNFWSDRCAYCLEEMPVLNRIYREYKDTDVVVLSIYRDSEQSLEKYFSDKKFNTSTKKFIEFPVIADAKDIVESYGIVGFPMTVIVDKEGNIAFISNYVTGMNQDSDSTTPLYYLILKGQIEMTMLM